MGARRGLPPDLLELELTESILLQDVDAAIRTLQRLNAIGVKLSIDDFGTDYSSLSYLKRLAVDKLKIDQSFVRDMLTDADGASIVKAIIQLGHRLQLRVIAEGVETEAQRAFLGGCGCNEAQGYLFSRPTLELMHQALHAHDDDAAGCLEQIASMLRDPANRRQKRALEATKLYLESLLPQTPSRADEARINWTSRKTAS